MFVLHYINAPNLHILLVNTTFYKLFFTKPYR